MIELEHVSEKEDRIVACRSSGVVTETDVETLFNQIEPIFLMEKPLRLLFDWSMLESFGPGARTASTWFALHHWAWVQRVAVICDGAWESEVLRVRDTCKAGTVRQFMPDSRDVAVLWLREP